MILRFKLFVALIWAADLTYGGEIIEGPSNVTVALDGIATLRCIVLKGVDEEVHWLRDDVLLFVERDIIPGVVSDEYRFSVVGSGNEYNLKITQVTVTDAEKYTCKVQSVGVGGTPSQKSSFLTVHRPPRKTNPDCSVRNVKMLRRGLRRIGRLTAHTYPVGTKISFQCNSDRGYPDIKLGWSDVTGSTINSTLDDSKAGFFTLHFTRNLTADDNRQFFTCTSTYTSSYVRNQTGSCEIGPLNVQYPPTSIGMTGEFGIDSDGNADFGKSLLITCNATGGNPQLLTYSWTFSPPIPAERYQESMHVLNLHSVEEADQGRIIQCSATNGIGEVIKTNITINVTNIPTTRGPTTRITTEPATTEKLPMIMSVSITMIIILILACLVILLATVCLVLFLINRKKKQEIPLQHMPISEASSDFSRSQSYARQVSTNTWLDDDACSLKGKGSRPGTPSMERRLMDAELKLEALSSGQFKKHDNIYGDSLGVNPEDSASNIIRRSPLPGHRQMLSPEPDDLKKPGKSPRDSPDSSCCSHCSHHSRHYNATTPNPEKPHKKLRPTNSTGPDWPTKYSPLARRHYSPNEQELNHYDSSRFPGVPNTYNTLGASPRTRRATHGDLEFSENENRSAFVKTHRRNRSHGSASLNGVLESPVSPVVSPNFVQHQHAASPVMQRKHRRKASAGSLNQLQVLQQGPPSHHSSPRASPRPSPNSSPIHRPHAYRPLPDPGLANEDLLISFDTYGSDPANHNYSNRTPVSARKQYTKPQHRSQEDYYDDDYIDDDEYDSYVDENEGDDSEEFDEM